MAPLGYSPEHPASMAATDHDLSSFLCPSHKLQPSHPNCLQVPAVGCASMSLSVFSLCLEPAAPPSPGQVPVSLSDATPEPLPLPLTLGLAEELLLCASHSLLLVALTILSWSNNRALCLSHPEPRACSYSFSAPKSSASCQTDLKCSVNHFVNETEQ